MLQRKSPDGVEGETIAGMARGDRPIV